MLILYLRKWSEHNTSSVCKRKKLIIRSLVVEYRHTFESHATDMRPHWFTVVEDMVPVVTVQSHIEEGLQEEGYGYSCLISGHWDMMEQ